MYPRLRDLREDRDLSQREVAKLLEMSQTGYSKYETGENDIPTSVLQRLADFYNVSVDYLLGRTNQKAPYPKSESPHKNTPRLSGKSPDGRGVCLLLKEAPRFTP